MPNAQRRNAPAPRCRRTDRETILTPTAERVCFIHVGTHKTGTTSIQAFLAENRDRLLDRGIFIPRGAGGGEEFACHHGIARQLLRGEPPGGSQGGLDEIRAELQASSARVSCISSEDISLLYDRPEHLNRLHAVIVGAGWTPRIVAYIRPQASYGVAIYAANVLSGYRLPFTTFLADVFEHGCYKWDGGSGPPFDYHALLDAFATAFGREAIDVRAFRSDARDSALLLSFMRVLVPGLTDLGGFSVPPKRANRTLTFSSVLRLLGVENTIDQHVRFAPLTFAELVRFRSRFAPSNRHLFARYGVKLPVVEPIDFVRASALRRSPALTRQLWEARRMFRRIAGEPAASSKKRGPAGSRR